LAAANAPAILMYKTDDRSGHRRIEATSPAHLAARCKAKITLAGDVF
jgi:hypothetical protein